MAGKGLGVYAFTGLQLFHFENGFLFSSFAFRFSNFEFYEHRLETRSGPWASGNWRKRRDMGYGTWEDGNMGIGAWNTGHNTNDAFRNMPVTADVPSTLNQRQFGMDQAGVGSAVQSRASKQASNKSITGFAGKSFYLLVLFTFLLLFPFPSF